MKTILTWGGRSCYAGGMKKLGLLALITLFAAFPLMAQSAEFYFERGMEYAESGDFDQVIENYTKTISVDPNYIHVWKYRERGAYFTAYYTKDKLDQIIDDFTNSININPNNAYLWYDRGLAYYNKGDFDRAIEDYSNAIALNPNDAHAWNNRGIVYVAKGELNRAIDDYNIAIAINPSDVYAWNNRGIAYVAKGELDYAIDDFNKAILLDIHFIPAWYNRGNVYVEKCMLNQAMQDFRQAIKIVTFEISFYAWQFAGSLYNTNPFLLGGISSNTTTIQRVGFAREAINQSIANAERARSRSGIIGTQIMTGLLYQYYAGIDFEAVFGSAEQAFTYSEMLRSRGFLEQMGTEVALRLPGIQETDAQNIRNLIQYIEMLSNLLFTLDPQTDENKITETWFTLIRKEMELAEMDMAIAQEVPRYAALRNPETATLAQAIPFCGDNRAILEYVIWDGSAEFIAPTTYYAKSSFPNRPSINSYCLVITNDGITAVRLDPEFNYAANVEALRSKLFSKDSRGRIVPGEESSFEAERNALYNALIRPVLEYIPANIENILIVPDSNLAFLPFDILRENNNPNTRSLGEYYSITLSPSVSVSILASQTEVAMREPVIAFGGAWYSPFAERNTPDYTPYARDVNNNRLATFSERLDEYYRRGSAGEAPLERASAVEHFGRRGWSYLAGTVAEVQGLERIATTAPTIIQGRDVSKRRVKELSDAGVLRNYPIIHFACHGYFNDNLTPQAALVFSEVSGLLGDDVDGYLSIEEIALLQLRARMVMLSACETGLGNLRRGDGMSGLARAFMVAGTQNVGVSLWEIDDTATTEFMWNVYRKVIREGRSFRNAYREVKEEFRRSARWNHPYYWAAFTMYE